MGPCCLRARRSLCSAMYHGEITEFSSGFWPNSKQFKPDSQGCGRVTLLGGRSFLSLRVLWPEFSSSKPESKEVVVLAWLSVMCIDKSVVGFLPGAPMPSPPGAPACLHFSAYGTQVLQKVSLHPELRRTRIKARREWKTATETLKCESPLSVHAGLHTEISGRNKGRSVPGKCCIPET